MVNDDPSPSESAQAADTGRHCDYCDYNLTGLTENRCPECGRPFDLKRNPEPRLSSIHVIFIIVHGLLTTTLVLVSALAIYAHFSNPLSSYRLGLTVYSIFLVQLPLLILGIFFGAIGAAAKQLKPIYFAFIFISIAAILLDGLLAISFRLATLL